MSIPRMDTASVIKFTNGVEIPRAMMPTVEPLDANATIEMKAASYGVHTPWYEVGKDREGFPVYQCASPISHNVYTVAYDDKRGHYRCNCTGGKRITRIPAHQAEATCWHLYEFNANHLPGIMAGRRASQPSPALAYSQSPTSGHKSGCLGVSFYPAPVSAETYATDWGA